MRGTLRQTFVLENKGMWNVHWRSRHLEWCWGQCIYELFSLTRPLITKTQQRYNRYYSSRNNRNIRLINQPFRPSWVNIHINKCYFAKSYSAKCCKEKIWNILGDRFMCEIILSHKHSFTDDLWCITYYIIYILTRIENMLIYVAHAYMHWGWTIYYYYFIKTIFGIWVKD